MKALILAAGYATRLYPLTIDTPKSLLKIKNRPILDYIVDCDEVIIIDAIQTVNGQAGAIYRLALDDFRVTKHTPSAHDVDLPTALEIGKILNMKLPGKISIVAIEIPDAYEFSNDLTPSVQAAVPLAAQMVKDILAKSQV